MEINRRLANAIKNTYPTNLLSSFYSYILYISSSLIVSPTLRKKRKIRKARRRFRQLDSETEESSFVSRRKARETQRAFLFKMHELSTFSFDRNRKKKEHRTPILDRGYPSPRNGSRIIPRTDDRPTAYNNVLQHRGQSLGWLGLN